MRIIDMGESVPWHSASQFWWTEGNFACDCNRELEFDALEEPRDGACGDERFCVPVARLEDGSYVELDGFDRLTEGERKQCLLEFNTPSRSQSRDAAAPADPS